MNSRRRNMLSLAVAAVLSASACVHAAETPATHNMLTIYSVARPGAIAADTYRQGGTGQNVPGYAVVRHERDVLLDRTRSTVRFTDVAALIDPTTVAFESLTDLAGTRVI